jgi:ketosteroid isomerase-like protein
VDIADAERFAQEWASDWNSHDLERILTHYADDVRWSSPVAVRLVGTPTLVGKEALRAYWAEGLRRIPDLHFEVESVRMGVDSIVIDYRNQDGQPVSEVLTFAEGQIVAGFGAYGRLPTA